MVLKFGTPVESVMVVEGLELYAVLGLKGNSVIGVVIYSIGEANI